MNHGITIVRHTYNDRALPRPLEQKGVLSVVSEDSDEQIIARILCSRLHDDEATSSAAKRCHTVHVWPPSEGYAWKNGAVLLMSPDQTCVARRTKALERWNGTAQPAPSADPCESVIT